MRSVTSQAHGLWVSVCVLLWLAAAPVDAWAQVYKWVDENGETHYRIERRTDGAGQRQRLRGSEANPVVDLEALRNEFGAEGPVREPDFTPRPDLETPIPAGELAPLPAPTVVAREAPEPAEPLDEELPGANLPDPLAPSDAPADDVYPQLAQNSARIAELEAQIQRDRETLRRVISEGKQQGLDLARDPQVREIAERLPRLHDELAQLRGQNR